MPTGQVLRWHTRIMMQPLKRSAAPVLKPNSSEPSSAAMATSRPVFNCPSVCMVDPAAEAVHYQRLLRLGQALIPTAGPQYLMLVSGARPRPAGVAADQDVIRLGLGDARGDRADAHFADQLHADVARLGSRSSGRESTGPDLRSL